MRTLTALVPALLIGLVALAPDVVASAQAPAQQPSGTLPDGFDVLEDCVEALGGEKAYRAHRTERMAGTIEVPALGATGRVVLMREASTKTRLDIELDGLGTMMQGTNGEVAWRAQPGSPPEMLEGDEAQRLIHEANYDAPVEPRKTYTSATTTGKVMLDGVECYSVDLVTSWGDHQVALFEVETGLHRRTSTREAPGSGTFTTETTYSDYRRVQGVKRPHKLEIKTLGMAQVIRFDTVELGVKFQKGTFDPPTK